MCRFPVVEVHFIYEHLYKVIQLLNSRIILDGKYWKDFMCKTHTTNV